MARHRIAGTPPLRLVRIGRAAGGSSGAHAGPAWSLDRDSSTGSRGCAADPGSAAGGGSRRSLCPRRALLRGHSRRSSRRILVAMPGPLFGGRRPVHVPAAGKRGCLVGLRRLDLARPAQWRAVREAMERGDRVPAGRWRAMDMLPNHATERRFDRRTSATWRNVHWPCSLHTGPPLAALPRAQTADPPFARRGPSTGDTGHSTSHGRASHGATSSHQPMSLATRGGRVIASLHTKPPMSVDDRDWSLRAR